MPLIYGRVLVLETTQGIANATVTFRSGDKVWEATTRANGSFEMPYVEPGWGYLSVTLPEGVSGQPLTDPILLHPQWEEPIELVWGVTTARGQAPITPVIQMPSSAIHANGGVTVTIQVPNNTDFVASRAQLTVAVPEGVQIRSATSNHGDIAVSGRYLAFRIGGLASGDVATMQVHLSATNSQSGYQPLSAWIVYGNFVAGQTTRNVTVNGLTLLPQTGIVTLLLWLVAGMGLTLLIVTLARRRLHAPPSEVRE